jgi:hypothetical protein
VYQHGKGHHGGPVALIGADEMEKLFKPLVLSFCQPICLQMVGC